MLEYRAAYYKSDDGWYTAEVLDFPGAVSQGRTLRSARRMIHDALQLMAICLIERGEPLPVPKPKASDKTADLVELIRLHSQREINPNLNQKSCK